MPFDGGDGAGPPTWAAWKGTGAAPPAETSARPGQVGGIRAASVVPTTSWDSVSSRILSAMRRLTLALMSAVTTPAGRWVARTTCTPSDLPRAAKRTMPSTNPGSSSARARNSSITTTSRASGWVLEAG